VEEKVRPRNADVAESLKRVNTLLEYRYLLSNIQLDKSPWTTASLQDEGSAPRSWFQVIGGRGVYAG
jgi:hypothetical protein